MRYNRALSTVELDIGELCTKYGSIGYESTELESLRQKTRDRLCSELGVFFSPDTELDLTLSVSGIRYRVGGRADGILKKDGKLFVYMIKGARTYGSIMSSLPSINEYGMLLCHLASAKYDAESVVLRTVFCEARDGKARETEKEYSSSLLSRTFLSLLVKKERFAKLAIAHETGGRDSIKNMKFPFGKMREGQRELIEACYTAIHKGKRLFAAAPTGIGKTISVLYPSVKALGSGLCDKIFYLTAKGSTKREAFEAVKRMFEAGASLKVIILSSKDHMCGNDIAKQSGLRLSSFCSGGCEMSRGYHSRSEDALYELLTSSNGYTPSLISKTAKKYGICPYELSLDLSEHCDIIICDYNYVFSPSVKLRRYFGELSDKADENYVFLTDEAHNLADRARDMYSAVLDFNTVKAFADQLPPDEGILSAHFEEFLRAFRGLKKLCADELSKDSEGKEQGFYFSVTPPAFFTRAIEKFLTAIDSHAKKHKDEPIAEILFELLSALRLYMSILEYYDEHFRTYILVYGGNITSKIYCIDPSQVLDRCMNRACSSVLFSATLTPADYFADVLGGSKNAMTLSLPSPFPRENLCLCAMTGISTRHEDRDKSYGKVASAIAAAVLPMKGNYIVYFPSYSYMEKVSERFAKRFPNVNILVQKRGMSYGEKEKFLDFFGDDKGILRIGFCVLGGSFSEGVDLPGSRLIGSIIIGVGLPGLSNELNIIRDFYELKYERGYDYAYTYPGMNKVLQACGRVIRRENDKGIVVLIDDRYETPQYRDLFPEHWENIIFASSASELAKNAENFWENTNNM